jgi:hypothetical protein
MLRKKGVAMRGFEQAKECPSKVGIAGNWVLFRRLRGLVVLLLLSSCAHQGQSALQTSTLVERQANADPVHADALEMAVTELIAKMKDACAREEFKPLFLHTACNAYDFTSAQLADTSRLAASDKVPFLTLHTEAHLLATRVAWAWRSYGGREGAEAALASERADSLHENNARALYDGKITWGDYNKRRREITDSFIDELYRIDRPEPSTFPPPDATLPA